jgi:pSer/pThr/pTyr-binding forkhead associated (FHA) protein
MKFSFTHIEGSRKGSKQDFDLPVITVGRDPNSTIAFDPVKDDRVSTKHAEIKEMGGQAVISDMGSRNGTFVNGTKITGTVPLPPGALVQFGDGGPSVMISFEAAAAPAAAPAPPPAKKGGMGMMCAVAGCGGVVLFGGLAVVLFLVFGRKAASEAPVAPSPAATTASTAPVAPSPAATTAAPAPTPAAPAASPSPAAVQGYESPWNKVGVGSSYEVESNMHMEKPAAMDMKSTIKYTLDSKTADEAVIKMETAAMGTTTPSEYKEKLRGEAAAGGTTKALEEKDESVTVPAGTFNCHYTKSESENAGTKTVIETWMAKDGSVPVAIKVVSSSNGESMVSKTTMELTKADKT